MSDSRQHTVQEVRHPDRDALARRVAETLADRLQQSLQQRQHASLIVPGGSTPVPIFRALRRHSLPWSRISVMPSDERWVPVSDAASNERLICEELLRDEAASARFISLRNASDSPWDGAADCARRLQRLARPVDAVLLGMGDDGHTASLFPRSEALADGLEPDSGADCVASHPEGIPQPRLSLGLRPLLDSRLLLLCLFGERKWRVYREALTANPKQMPVAAVLRQTRTPVIVHWAP